jgi:hypothetical protein
MNNEVDALLGLDEPAAPPPTGTRHGSTDGRQPLK